MVKKKMKKTKRKFSKNISVKKIQTSKKSDLAQIAYWTPRILIILVTILISLFALDIPGEYSGIKMWQALFMHLIPTMILAIFLIIAWKYEKIGGSLFLALGVIFGIFFNAFESLSGFLVLVLPLWLIGILFWVSAKLNSK